MICRVLILSLLSTIAVLVTPQSTERYLTCNTPNDRIGECIPLQSCNSLKQLIEKVSIFPEDVDFLQRSQCGHNNVCCPDAHNSSVSHGVEEPTTVPTTSKRVQTGRVREPTLASTTRSPLSTARISTKKCNEYKEFAYNKTYSSNTLVDDPLQVRLSNCAFSAVSLIGGNIEAKVKEFPHMALIGFRRSNKTLWLCGGTLISEQFVLSAAYCSDSILYGSARYVRLGEHDQNRTDDAISIDFDIIERIPHPNYEFSHYDDIALFKLNRKVDFNNAIRPACLPEQLAIPMEVMTVGWGTVEHHGEISKVLLKTNLQINLLGKCNRTITQVCARYHTACGQRDSGGPLQIYHERHHCTHTVVGVTSVAIKCKNHVGRGIYTRVYPYLSWIESIVWASE